MKEENIPNISCYKLRDYFSLKFYSSVGRRAAGVLLSICQPGAELSSVAIASRHAADDTSAKGTLIYIYKLLSND